MKARRFVIVLAFGVGCSSQPEPDASTSVATGDPAVGAECTPGCSTAPPKRLERAELEALLQRVARDPVGQPSEVLEALLFHHQQVDEYLSAYGGGPLSEDWAAFLHREVSRQHALIEMQIIDSDGRKRAVLPPTRVPLGSKRHIHFKHYEALQPLEASGTVVRVGLQHLWSRY